MKFNLISSLLKINLSLLFSGILLTSYAQSFEIGLDLGTNVTQLNAKNKTTEVTAKSNGYLGYQGGLIFRDQFYQSRKSVSLGWEVDILYSQRKFGDNNVINAYKALEVPVFFKVHMAGFSLGLGGYYAKRLGQVSAYFSTGNDEFDEDPTLYSYADMGVKTSEIGAIASLTYSFPVGSGFLLSPDLRYVYNFVNNSTSPNITRKNTAIEAHIQLTYAFGKSGRSRSRF